MLLRKIIKSIVFPFLKIISLFKPSYGTTLLYYFYRWLGVDFCGRPNFIASSVWFDGTDYSLIYLGREVTVSSGVIFLTHDWALYTVRKGLERPSARIGRIDKISVGDYSFIGMGAILLPGSKVGKCCIVGAGSVIRGVIPDYSIVVGNPASVVKDVREYV